MKKKLLVLLFLFSSLALAVAAPSFGYSVTGRGETFQSDFGGAGLSLVFEPFEYGIATLEAGAIVGNDSVGGFCIPELYVSLSTPVFYVLSPFDFLFANKMIWAPRLSVIAAWNSDFTFRPGLGFSPFHFEDPSFRYDFLAPYVLTDTAFDDWGWGIDVLRVTYVF
jgi:hypothetical protein